MIRLLCLVPKPKGLSPGQRFRLEQWAPILEAEHGIRLEFAPFESPKLTELLYLAGHRPAKAALVLFDFARRATALPTLREYDGVIVYREAALLGPAIYERLFHLLGVPMFFDFDDAIWMPQIGVNGIFSHLHFWGKTKTICRLSSAVTVGNEHLKAFARRHSSNVHLVPTSIALERYPVQPEFPESEPFTILWSGSTTTLVCFERARAALERFAATRRTVVKVICNRPPERPIANAENVFVPWREDGEAEEIGKCHVGIMPLADDEYTKGKCGLKALQYMATGRVAVVSPVGMNADLVVHGENGLLARTDDEWVAAFEQLARSADLRRTLGLAGRATVEAAYSAGPVAALYAEAIKSGLAPDTRTGAHPGRRWRTGEASRRAASFPLSAD